MPKPSAYAELFALELNARHGNAKTEFGIESGSKYDKVTKWYINHEGQANGKRGHCFIEKKTGFVYKPAGWAAPAKGVRYTNVLEAAEASDPHGSYLYAK